MPAKISFIYLLLGILWIIAGGIFVNYFEVNTLLPKDSIYFFEISKGLVYVFLTTIFIYLALSKAFKNQEISALQYRKLFNESPFPIWIYDTKTFQFLAVNQAAIASYEYSENEFLKMTIKNIYEQEDWDNFQNLIIRNSIKPNRGIWRHQTKSGEIFLVDIYSNPIQYYEHSACLVSAINVHDKILADKKNMELGQTLSEYKEHLEIQNRSLREIAWAHSHKLRAPVANILGLIPLLNRKDSSDPINFEVLEKILQCTQNLDSVIHEIVDKSSTE